MHPLILYIALSLFICGCSITRKLSAADILQHTTLDVQEITLDSVVINQDLFPKSDALKQGLLPNPQVVALVQDFARGILEKEIGAATLSVRMQANNQGQDTLWIRDFTATIKSDSILDLPISLKDSVMLLPGTNYVEAQAKMPIDRRLFKLMDVQNVAIVGKLEVAIDEDGESILLDIDLKRSVSQEEKQALADQARTSVLNNIVSNWVGAIFPLE